MSFSRSIIRLRCFAEVVGAARSMAEVTNQQTLAEHIGRCTEYSTRSWKRTIIWGKCTVHAAQHPIISLSIRLTETQNTQ